NAIITCAAKFQIGRADVMGKNYSLIEQKTARIGIDGELTAGKFCAYCGNLNDAGAATCEHCGEYIADQGPDLANRLARISRRASHATPSWTGLIGTVENARSANLDHTAKITVDKFYSVEPVYESIAKLFAAVLCLILGFSLGVLLVYIF